jgi:hypothetical protein
VTGRLLAVALSIGAASCTSNPGPTGPVAETSPTPRPTVAAADGTVTMAQAKDCPVTLPEPVGPSGPNRNQLFGWGAAFGNGKLWVGGLWPHGILAVGPGFVDRHGRVGMKFGWWRGVPGRLHITGRRLDASAPHVRSDVPAGYGASGFQATGVTFPTERCWEVIGSVHRTELSFVTFVIKKGKSS